jgi:peptidoglycan/LPS O-acetylase OafA/YrhL
MSAARAAEALPALDGLRGVLCLFIIVGHIATFFTPWDLASPTASPLAAAFGLEYLSPVSLFLLLSGFTLTHTYGRAGEEELPTSPRGVLQFFYKRWARLASMYYLSLALSVPFLVFYADSSTLLTSALATPLMVQSLALAGNSFNGPLWTVSALALCYLAFPSLLRALRRRSTAALWAIAGASYALSVAIAQLWLIFLPSAAIILHMVAPLRVPQFVLGMCAALLLQRTPPRRPALLVWTSAGALALNAGGCLAAVAATAPNFALQQGWSFTAEWWVPPLHALLVVGLAAPAGAGGLVQRALSARPAVLLGQWSYAAYCLHFPLLLTLGMALKGGAMPLVWGFAWVPFPAWSTPLLLLYVLLCAAVAHRCIEAPVSRWLRPRGAKAAHGDAAPREAGAEGEAEGGPLLVGAAPLAHEAAGQGGGEA